MGLFSEEVKTSVSMYIEKLTNLEEIDWYLFQQLTESMIMQDSGPREAIETIRKKLKHGGTQQKLRALEVLKLLMENSNQNFHRQMLANEKLLERFELILNSPGEDSRVKKELLILLGTWSDKYKNEPGMRSISHLYESGRGRRTRPVREQTVRSPDTDSFQTPQSPQSPQSPPRERRSSLPPPSMPQRPADQYQPSVTTTRSNRSHSAVASRPPTNLTTTTTGERVFNFEKAKPKIIQEVAMANQLSNNLINALKLINTNQDRWEIVLQRDKRVQETRDKCEEAKKKIVRYARLVEDEEWIGTLLAANEDLLKALDVYDIMSVGEIPASWNTLHHEGSHYDTEPAAVSYSAPLQIEDSMSRLRIETAREEPDELEDPFADPVTPEDEYYEHRR